jgi:hypothetical protein
VNTELMLEKKINGRNGDTERRCFPGAIKVETPAAAGAARGGDSRRSRGRSGSIYGMQRDRKKAHKEKDGRNKIYSVVLHFVQESGPETAPAFTVHSTFNYR